MRNWGSMEDYTGMRYIREHIPAENDVYLKMKPSWGKLYYRNGDLLYEGFMADGMAYGAGTSYYPYGHPCQEGIFGPNGLVCGREYYNNGQIRFEGTYQYNPGFGENWPVFGAFYDAEGNLAYYGAFDIIQEDDWAVRPYVMEPENYGPVMNPLITVADTYRFRGEKIRKYYTEESPEFRDKVYREEKETQWKHPGKEKTLARLRKGLASVYPEVRAVAEEELRRMGEWTEEDEKALNTKQKQAESVGRRMTGEERYRRDLRLLNVSTSFVKEQLQTIGKMSREEKDRAAMEGARLLESMYPYKWGHDPRHSQIGKPLEERGINPDNWLRKLDEMTDREISYMLDQEFGVGRLNEERLVCPLEKDRTHAEFMRDFGL